MNGNIGCEYKSRCPHHDKLNLDEQKCCDDEFYTCPLWRQYLKDELILWTWWQISEMDGE